MNNETQQILLVNNVQSQPSTSTPKVPDSTQASLDGIPDELDYSKVCRACAAITELVIPIYGEEGLQNNLADKINKHLPIQVCSTDVLPVVVCYQCASTLLAWHELVACCEQADVALRARLAREQKPTPTLNSEPSVKEETKSKFTPIPEYVVQSMEPPAYMRYSPEEPQVPLSPRKPALRVCQYCARGIEPTMYKEHLVVAHGDFLFHCEECDKYIDKKDFMVHMTLHVAHIVSEQEKKELKRRNTNTLIRTLVRKKKEAPDINQNTTEVVPAPHVNQNTTEVVPAPHLNQNRTEVVPAPHVNQNKTEVVPAPHVNQNTTEVVPAPHVNQNRTEVVPAPHVNQNTTEVVPEAVTSEETDVKPAVHENENEFSDHSDTEYGFGPLPESVFEAIEDTQDIQPLDENVSQTPDSENNLDNPDPPVAFHGWISINGAPIPIETSNNSNCSPTPTGNNDSPRALSDTSNLRTCAVVVSPLKPHELNTARRVETDASSDKPHKRIRACPICLKEYAAASSYFYHMKYNHKNVKDHECQVCSRKFGTKACLTQHLTIHTGERQYECKECKKTFRSKASLYIHEQTHNGIKSWSCTQCRSAFRWKTHLLRHMKRHSAEKGHVCETCGRGFSVRCDLLRHARTHTAGNLNCEKCGQKFGQMRYLKVHMAKKHSL